MCIFCISSLLFTYRTWPASTKHLLTSLITNIVMENTRSQHQQPATSHEHQIPIFRPLFNQKQSHYNKDIQWDSQHPIDSRSDPILNKPPLQIPHTGPIHTHARLKDAKTPKRRLLIPHHDRDEQTTTRSSEDDRQKSSMRNELVF